MTARKTKALIVRSCLFAAARICSACSTDKLISKVVRFGFFIHAMIFFNIDSYQMLDPVINLP
jgi:hypothetical protein